MGIKNVLLLEENFSDLKRWITSIQLMEFRVYLIVAAFLQRNQGILVSIIPISPLTRKGYYCFGIVEIALYQLLLNSQVIFVELFIIIRYQIEKIHCFFHISLIVFAHRDFHLDFHFTFVVLKSIKIALRGLFVLLHFLISIAQNFLSSFELRKILQSLLALIH